MINTSKPIYTLTTFTPQEAEQITGVSVDLQRVWRKRGFLPKTEGHARFNLITLAEMKALKAMTDVGVVQHLREELAPLCVYRVVKNVLANDCDFPMSRIYEGAWQNWFDHDFPRPSAFVDHSAAVLETVADYNKREALECRKSGDNHGFRYATANEIARYITVDASLFQVCEGWGSTIGKTKDMLIITGGNTPHWVWPREFAEEMAGADSVRRALEDASGVMLHLGEFARGMMRKTMRPFVKILLPEIANA